LAFGQSPHRDKRSPAAGTAGTGRAERLASISTDTRGAAPVPLPRTLEQLSALAAIRGDAADAALFSEAATLVRSRRILTDADLAPLVEAGPAGPGPRDRAIHTQLRYMYEAGAWVLLESAIADIPADLRWLFESGAVTVEQLAALHQSLGATSAADLADAVRRQAIRTVSGLDATIEFAVGTALSGLRAAIPRIPLGRAVGIAAPILERLERAPGVASAEPVGSLRRGQETVGDIEIVGASVDPAAAIEELLAMPGVVRALHRSARRLYLLLERVQVGIRFPEPARAGATLLWLTGTPAHFDRLAELARERGGRLDAGGLRQEDGSHVAGSEQAIYAALGLPWIPPEIRDGGAEIEAARHDRLPSLVGRSDVRGDLHMHSNWSDGQDTVEAMAAGCHALGYEYMAITDHSPRCAASRTLTSDNVKRQADEIARVRERFPSMAILHGCEVDILPDGRLDFPDRILEQFDIVLASLHERAGQSPDRLMDRYERALRHPLVALITHPTNRLVPARPGYDLDWDRLFAIAVDTGTLLEVDGGPVHLDLDGALARRAIAAGATLLVDSDSHRADLLDRQMGFGLTTARRGWVEARHVLNTRPLPEVRNFIARKRSGRG
jgi:DNA polymerase (family 10)